MESFNWRCPYCQQNATINENNCREEEIDFLPTNDKGLAFNVKVITCPNTMCGRYSIIGELKEIQYYETDPYEIEYSDLKTINHYKIDPEVNVSKTFPNYIPEALKKDYKEACLIKDLSPKASATLSRRCVQGIIRDNWEVKGNTLFQEIESIKGLIDPLLLEAIDAIREVGNIGAHMQKDINIIIDVEPDEAELLIELIETLFEETYIRNYEKKQRLEKIIKLGNLKKQQRLKGCEG